MRRKVGFNSPADYRGNPGSGTACFKDLNSLWDIINQYDLVWVIKQHFLMILEDKRLLFHCEALIHNANLNLVFFYLWLTFLHDS